MSNEQVSTLISILIPAIFALLGVGLIWYGTRRKKKNRIIWILGVGFLGSVVLVNFVESAQLREILTAAASISAVFIAALSINETRRLRKESADKETRDRKERLLSEIMDWARRVLQCWTESGVTPSATDFQRLTLEQANRAIAMINKINHVTWLIKLEALESESESIKANAIIFENKKLNKAIDEVDKKLLAHIGVVKREVGKGKTQAGEYHHTVEELKDSAITLSKLVGSIRAKLISKIG
jgi:hypothetical protein